MNCKFCSSPRTMKYGIKAGTQYYKCNDCRRKFAGKLAPAGMRFTTATIGEAMGLFYDGLSLADISRHLASTDGVYVDPATVWRWIIRYSRGAARLLNEVKVKTSWRWVIDETMIKVAGQNVWLWDIIEAKSRFLLATHLTTRRDMRSAVAVLAEANGRTTGTPSYIISDGMRAYPDAVERVFGTE